MEPLRCAWPLLVFLAFICYVRCQWNQIGSLKVDLINPKGLRNLNQEGNPHITAPYMEAVPYRPTAPVIAPPSQSYDGGPSPTLGRGTREAFALNHKITTDGPYNIGLAQFSATWAKKAGDIRFQFVNPVGLRILLPVDDFNFRIVTFDIKINEDFKSFDDGHYIANITRTSDGRWSYYYPNLKLKQGDRVFHRTKVMFGKDMWLYSAKGALELKLSDPHNVLNPIRTTTTSPRPTHNSNRTTPSPRPTYEVDNKPAMAGGIGGEPVKWDHKHSINKTNNDDSAPEEEQLVKNIIEKNMEFKFLNPSGLSILFSGEDKDFRVLAFNIKLNEQFKTLGPGDYVANVTRSRDGRLNYYYLNLKVRLGDKVYYWIRVALVKYMTDYIVAGEFKLKQGDPHIGGPVPDVPAPMIWTQTFPRLAETSVALSNNQPPNQASATLSPVLENNNQAPIQLTSTQTPIP